MNAEMEELITICNDLAPEAIRKVIDYTSSLRHSIQISKPFEKRVDRRQPRHKGFSALLSEELYKRGI